MLFVTTSNTMIRLILILFIILPASLHAVDPVLIDRLGKSN